MAVSESLSEPIEWFVPLEEPETRNEKLERGFRGRSINRHSTHPHKASVVKYFRLFRSVSNFSGEMIAATNDLGQLIGFS